MKITEMELKQLTEKDREVLIGLYEGKTDKEIAIKLNLSLAGVQTRTRVLYKKLEVSGRMQAVVWLARYLQQNPHIKI